MDDQSFYYEIKETELLQKSLNITNIVIEILQDIKMIIKKPVQKKNTYTQKEVVI